MPIVDPRVAQEAHLSISGSLVTVRVGSPSAKVFTIHKNILLSRVLSRSSVLSIRQSPTDLPSIDPDSFQLYYQYLYTQRIPCQDTTEVKDDGAWIDKAKEQMNKLIKFYLMAQELKDIIAMDAAVNAMMALHIYDQLPPPHEKNGFHPTPNNISLVYQQTSPQSGLRALVIDIFVSQADPRLLFEGNRFPEEFMLPLAKTALTRLDQYVADQDRGLRMKGCCNFHEPAWNQNCSMVLAGDKRKRDETEGGREWDWDEIQQGEVIDLSSDTDERGKNGNESSETRLMYATPPAVENDEDDEGGRPNKKQRRSPKNNGQNEVVE